MAKHTVPYIIFKDELLKHLISIDCYDEEWFESQSERIGIWWNTGETLAGAKEMIEIFARGHLDRNYIREMDPLNPTICKGVTTI